MEQENVHLRGQLDVQAAQRVAAACITEGGQAGSLVERAASRLSDSQAEVGSFTNPQAIHTCTLWLSKLPPGFLSVRQWLVTSKLLSAERAASRLSKTQVEVGCSERPGTPCSLLAEQDQG